MKKIIISSFVVFCSFNVVGQLPDKFWCDSSKLIVNKYDSFYKPNILYVIDNKIQNLNFNPLKKINQSYIEKIRVLSDVDATIIYGDEGVNGAVLITMKKGWKKYNRKMKRGFN